MKKLLSATVAALFISSCSCLALFIVGHYARFCIIMRENMEADTHRYLYEAASFKGDHTEASKQLAIMSEIPSRQTPTAMDGLKELIGIERWKE